MAKDKNSMSEWVFKSYKYKDRDGNMKLFQKPVGINGPSNNSFNPRNNMALKILP